VGRTAKAVIMHLYDGSSVALGRKLVAAKNIASSDFWKKPSSAK
jgi:hypothetical protein